jgi:hypothetical protein
MTGRILMLACAASLAGACGGGGRGGESKPAEQQPAATPAPLPSAMPADVQLAVAVAQAIEAAPARADSILSAHGLTRAGLDSLMYEIAADSAKAATYAAARH